MRAVKTLLTGLVMALLVSGASMAGTHLNEVGAFLVYPTVAGLNGDMINGLTASTNVVSILTITNAGGDDVVAHVSFIDGASTIKNGMGNPIDNPEYCFECDFFVPMSPNDTDTLVVYADGAASATNSGGDGVNIFELDTGLEHSCAQRYGMVVVALENADEETQQDNVLLGEQIVIDFTNNTAYSIPAIPFQGKNMGNTDRWYSFDDQEYGKLPRIVAADFIAPKADELFANLTLFTLGFERQHPPQVDCSVTGFDAAENPFSRSVLFGCWETFQLEDISSEFEWGNLGAFACDDTAGIEDFGYCDEHGWLSLNCRVDKDADGDYDIDGGVHGAIVQTSIGSKVLDKGDANAVPLGNTMLSNGAWGRLLYQSVTTGSAATLHLEGTPGSLLP